MRIDSRPRCRQNVRSVLGDRVLAALLASQFSEDRFVAMVDISTQRAALKTTCKLEAAQQIWKRQLTVAR